MKHIKLIGMMILAGISTLTVAVAADPAPPTRCFELRIYHAAEGKLDALEARFRDHTMSLFTRHGMTNEAYWTPVENPQRLLVYLLSYPDLAAREAAWKAFGADPDWVAASKASEVGGKLVEKVDSRFLAPTDFSPAMKPDAGDGPHVFEMRTYTATPGNLPRLLARFRNHTVALFSKHGMEHFGYFTPMPGQPGADDTLIYFLRHSSKEARDRSFADFTADPDWIKAKADSEAAAGGPLTIPDGVKSELLVPTGFSPVK